MVDSIIRILRAWLRCARPGRAQRAQSMSANGDNWKRSRSLTCWNVGETIQLSFSRSPVGLPHESEWRAQRSPDQEKQR